MVLAGPFHLQPHLTMLDGKGLVLTPCMSGLSFLAHEGVVWLDQPEVPSSFQAISAARSEGGPVCLAKCLSLSLQAASLARARRSRSRGARHTPDGSHPEWVREREAHCLQVH